MKKHSFVLYTSLLDSLNGLSKEDIGDLFLMILEYESKIENFDPKKYSYEANIAFGFIKPQLDINDEKYERHCIARRENGKKGGRPRLQTNNLEKPRKPSRFFNNLEKPDNDNDNDNDNDSIYIPKKKSKEITEEILQETSKRFGVSYEYCLDMVERIKDYEKSHGKRYKDYPATLRNWIKMEKERNPKRKMGVFEQIVSNQNDHV
jgi:hypothetical protein